jgi:hypothetical protein
MGDAEAMNYLGLMYEDRWGRPIDHPCAFANFR